MIFERWYGFYFYVLSGSMRRDDDKIFKLAGIDLESFKSLLNMINDDVISYGVATKELLPIIKETKKDPYEVFVEWKKSNTFVSSDLNTLIDGVILKYPEKVKEYKSGKENLINMFVGEVIKSLDKKVDPKVLKEFIKNKLT